MPFSACRVEAPALGERFTQEENADTADYAQLVTYGYCARSYTLSRLCAFAPFHLSVGTDFNERSILMRPTANDAAAEEYDGDARCTMALGAGH